MEVKDKLLIDYNNMFIRNASYISNALGTSLSEQTLKHSFIDALLSLRKKFKNEEFIICCDNNVSWRKNEFPYYKALRVESRANNPLDWDLIFSSMKSMKKDLVEYFPYKVVSFPHAEGDDVIACLVHYFQVNQLRQEGLEHVSVRVNIISSDHDFVQLQTYSNVRQYVPLKLSSIEESDPVRYLQEKIICGDRGDSIPSIRNNVSCFVDKIRQKPITQKNLEEWKTFDDIPLDMRERFIQNKKLIDLFESIPKEIEEGVISSFHSCKSVPRIKLQTFFVKNKMVNFIQEIGRF